MAQEARRFADLGLKPLEIATRLGINKSTVTRWMAAGKLTRTTGVVSAKVTPPELLKPDVTPREWSEAVRREYDLNATDAQLVTLAEGALAVSLDLTVTPQVRMTASGRFQSLVRQLALVARGAEKVPDVPNTAPAAVAPRALRPVGADPRVRLMSVVAKK